MRDRTIRRQAERARKAGFKNQHTTYRPGIVAFVALLVVATAILYGSVRQHSFINYDDAEYIIDNQNVTNGLSLQAIRWSLTSTEQCNWHPLTWISHILDFQLFGLDAGLHHINSVIIHIVTVVLLFIFLQRSTGDRVASFFVAALFAWHPFSVESVAWAAERKNVLSTFWFVLTLLAYYQYGRQPKLKYFAAVAMLFVLALMSKPMAVTLPFVLLLLDYWPLGRVRGTLAERDGISQQPVSRLLLEKVPLFALAAASSAVTVWAQRSCGALRTLKAVSFLARLENAFYSYLLYIEKTVWPSGFALFYPRSPIPLWKVTLAVAVLCAISVAVWRERISRPCLAVGWLWFVGTLVPVIGIVQVGEQAMADRYAYLPSIGLFIMITWSAAELLNRRKLPLGATWTFATLALLIVWILAYKQIQYWQDSVTVWSHTLEVTSANSLAEKRLAFALSDRGDTEGAQRHFRDDVNIDPTDFSARVNLGVAYARAGRLQDGIDQLELAVKQAEGKKLSAEDYQQRCSAFIDLGFAYTISKKYREAFLNFQKANQADPADLERTMESVRQAIATRGSEINYLNLALILRAEGKEQESSDLLKNIFKANPEYTQAIELSKMLDEGQN